MGNGGAIVDDNNYMNPMVFLFDVPFLVSGIIYAYKSEVMRDIVFKLEKVHVIYSPCEPERFFF